MRYLTLTVRAAASQVADCKARLSANGISAATIAESCIGNAGGDSLLANREVRKRV